MMKRFFFILIILSLTLTQSGVFAASGDGGGDGYYRAVSGMVRSHWRDDYFQRATLNTKDSTIKIDNRKIKLKNKVSVEQGEWMIPVEVLEALGATVEKDTKGIRARKNGRLIEATYDDKDISVNGKKKSVRNSPGLKNGEPVVPESVLAEDGLGFEIKKSSDEIVITNSFQTMRVLTKVRSGKSLPEGIQTEQTIAGPDGLYVLQFSTADAAKAACEMLNASSNIIYAEPDGIVLLDEAVPAEVVQYDVHRIEAGPNQTTPTEAGPADATPVEAEVQPKASYAHLGWGPKRIGSDAYMDYLIVSGKQNASVKVAVVDSGLDTGHSYFSGRQIAGYNMLDGNTTMSDSNGHGTHVAGTVIDVTIGMPNVKVMPVKVLGDDGYGTNIQVANGVYWAADHGAQVINMSLGGEKNLTVDSAVRYAVGRNATVVVAAGNDHRNTADFSPARVESAITVAAIYSYDYVPSFSNEGSSVDVAAPGVGIVSARSGGGTISMNGTSMASPHVAGAAALLLCDNPALAPSAVESLIRATAEDKGTPGFDTHYGYGILNIGNAADLSDAFLTAKLSTETGYLDLHQTIQIHVTYSKKSMVSDVTASAHYFSSDATIATVDAGGILTTGSVSGKAVITVSYQGSMFDLPVDVGPMLTGLTVSPDGPIDLAIGEQKDLTLTAHYSDGSQKTVWPASWYMSSYCCRGETYWPGWWYDYTSTSLVIHGADVSQSIITPIYIERGVELTTSTGILINVGKEMMDHIAISPESMDLAIGDQAKIGITAVCKDGTSFELSGVQVSSAIIEIMTSNPDVAVVNEVIPGYYTRLDDIYATGEGTATITATFMGVEAMMDVTVRGGYKNILLAGLPVNLEVGGVIQSRVYAVHNDGSYDYEPCGVVWESSDPGVANAIPVWGEPSSSYLKIVGVSPGTATITARLPGGLAASGVVTVDHCQSVYLPQETMHIEPGQRESIWLRGQYENGSDVIPGGVTWESSDPSVVSVAELWYVLDGSWPDQAYITGIVPGTATITARTAGGLEATCIVTVGEEEPPTGVTVSPKTVTLDHGTTLPLTATVSPYNASADKTVSWSSDNIAIATVSADGLVTAVAPGTATITAQTANGQTDTCVVTVLATVLPNGITISPETLIFHGYQQQLVPTISPTGVTDKTVLWSSDDESVAKVSARGLVTAVAPGTATITAQTHNGKTATCAITVEDRIADLTLSVPDGTPVMDDVYSVPVNGTLQIGTSVKPQGISHTLTFKSSDDKVASVGKTSGLVRGIKNGQTTITVTAKDSKGLASKPQKLKISVITPVGSVSLPAEAQILTGAVKRLTAAISPSSASDKAHSWFSGNIAVATVAQDGTVKALKTGTAIIIARATNGKAASCLVQVTDPATDVQITTDTGKTYMDYKTYMQLTATVDPGTAYGAVTWKSTDTAYVTVDANGKVYGRKVGKPVTIYATAADGTGVRGSIAIQVITPVTAVNLPETDKIFIGRTKKLTVTLSPPSPTFKVLTWESSDDDVATVAADGTITANALGTAVITATAYNGMSDNCAVTVAQPVTDITLTQPENGMVVYKGETTEPLEVVITPGNASDQGVTWKSSKDKYARVNDQGVVTGRYPGKVKITATAKDGSGVPGSINLTVAIPATSIRLSRTSTVLYHNGETDALKTVRLTAAASPKGSVYRSLTWSVESGDDVATVDASTGLVTALKEGTAVIRATTDRGYPADCTVTVRTLPATFSLNPPEKTLAIKQSFNLEAIFDEECTEKALTWSVTQKKKVVAVSSTGLVKASKDTTGTAIITATTKNGIKATCKVTVVRSLPPKGITNAAAKGEMPPLITLRLMGGGYKTSDDHVAVVDGSGIVELKADGAAALEAGGKHIGVKVEDGNLAELKLDEGVELLLTTGVQVRWTVKDGEVAVVDGDGRLIAISKGTTTLTCQAENGGEWTIRLVVTQPDVDEPQSSPQPSAEHEVVLPEPTPSSEPEVTPGLEPTAEPAPSVEPEPTEEPEPTAAPEPEPERAPEPEPSPAPPDANGQTGGEG